MILGLLTALWLILNSGGPTFAFVKTDEFTVASTVFGGTSSSATNYINVTIQNTGSSTWTLQSKAQVNNVTSLKVSSTYGLTCVPNYSITVKIANVNWTDGNQYLITLLLTDGNKITYVAGATPGGQSPDPYPGNVTAPSPMEIIGSALVTYAPEIVALLSATAEIAVGLGVLVYITRKHVNYDADMIGFAVCMIVLAAGITFTLVLVYLTPPLTFSLNLGF